MLLIQVTKIFQKKKNSVTYSFRQSFSLYGMQVLLFENQCKWRVKALLTPYYPFRTTFNLVHTVWLFRAGVSSENQAFHYTGKQETGVKGYEILDWKQINSQSIVHYSLFSHKKIKICVICDCEMWDYRLVCPSEKGTSECCHDPPVCKYSSPAAAFQITPMECVSLQLFQAQTSRFSLTSTPPTRKTARSSQMICGSPSQRCRRWRSTE